MHTSAIKSRAIARQNAIRTPRAAAIAGIVFAVLMGTTQILVNLAIPETSDDPGEWINDDNRRRAVAVALGRLEAAFAKLGQVPLRVEGTRLLQAIGELVLEPLERLGLDGGPHADPGARPARRPNEADAA